jgi:hypothetical protein
MNKGILRSKGDWICFLGSGDKLSSITILNDIFESSISKKFDMISGKILYQGDTNPFIYNKNKRLKTPSWSFLMWLRNGLHHQGTFYKKELFLKQMYRLEYPVLSDYWFHLFLYKQQKKCYLTSNLIAICNSDGVSKKGSWTLYKEELELKINSSSMLFLPIFYSIIIMKYLMQKL